MRSDCEICGGEKLLSLNERRDDVDIVVCESCGLVWNRIMRDEQGQVEYYRKQYREAGKISRRYLISVLSRAACVLDFLGDDLKPEMRHLDVGCADGTLLALTRAHGLDVTGLELDVNYSRFARETRQLRVFPTTIQDTSLPSASFDLVSFVHVLEHLFHPVCTLRLARELLCDNGWLYVEVPNLSQPLPGARRFFRHQHNFYFTANTLRSLVSKAGFTPVRIACSRRDVSLQVLAVKGDVTDHPPAWREDAKTIYAHVNTDRKRYYLMLRLLKRRIRQERLRNWAFNRYGDMLPEVREFTDEK
jgi:2-polyprenyl-3-methyl-5-hydroxy-6-metoxy-1,4-benzoquinol methylase